MALRRDLLLRLDFLRRRGFFESSHGLFLFLTALCGARRYCRRGSGTTLGTSTGDLPLASEAMQRTPCGPPMFCRRACAETWPLVLFSVVR